MNSVAIMKCRQYDSAKIQNSLNESFNLLGGIDKYIRPGMKVLLKCNLLSKKSPEEAVTTHPAVVEALANIITGAGALPIIADSPGGLYIERALKGIYKACGMADVAQRTGAVLNYDTHIAQVRHPEGKILKSLTVIGLLEEVDAVISVAKLKTHGMMLYTGAVKNLFGVIPGTSKAEYHLRMKKVRDFSDALVDICTYVKPVISVIDGIVGMEGDGPSAGDPRNIGAILVSSDPFALDVAACHLTGIPLEKVPTIQRAKERGLCSSLDQIRLIGDDINDIRIDDFKLPITGSSNFFERWFSEGSKLAVAFNSCFGPKPIFNKKVCIGCGVCMKNCPPKAIVMVENKPSVDLKKCIRCYCCHELCPEKAIDIKRNFVFRIFR